jgi:hypothetical protein
MAQRAGRPYFVKRRDQAGKIINTLCRTLDDALSRDKELRKQGDADVKIEDADGNFIENRTDLK